MLSYPPDGNVVSVGVDEELPVLVGRVQVSFGVLEGPGGVYQVQVKVLQLQIRAGLLEELAYERGVVTCKW